MLTRFRISAAAMLIASLLGSGVSACDEVPKPGYVTVPSNVGRDLGTALERLRDAGLQASIRDFPDLPCGYGLDRYQVFVQSPRAPARVRRGSVVEVTVVAPPIPSPVSRADRPEFTTIPDLVELRYSGVRDRLDGIWPCFDEVPPLTPDASREGLDAYEVVDQDLDPGLRLPYGGAHTREGGFRPTVLHICLALRDRH